LEPDFGDGDRELPVEAADLLRETDEDLDLDPEPLDTIKFKFSAIK
jgi:hypothetical protein